MIPICILAALVVLFGMVLCTFFGLEIKGYRIGGRMSFRIGRQFCPPSPSLGQRWGGGLISPCPPRTPINREPGKDHHKEQAECLP